jgi:hypothetical protein
MAIKFTSPVKHGRHQFIPGVPLAFDDARAEEYFVAAGWAEATQDDAVHTYPEGSVEIDPETVFSGTGQKVLTNG